MSMISEHIRTRELEIKALNLEILSNTYGKTRAKEILKSDPSVEVGRMSLVIHGSDAKYIWNKSRELGLSHDAFIHEVVQAYKNMYE